MREKYDSEGTCDLGYRNRQQRVPKFLPYPSLGNKGYIEQDVIVRGMRPGGTLKPSFSP